VKEKHEKHECYLSNFLDEFGHEPKKCREIVSNVRGSKNSAAIEEIDIKGEKC